MEICPWQSLTSASLSCLKKNVPFCSPLNRLRFALLSWVLAASPHLRGWVERRPSAPRANSFSNPQQQEMCWETAQPLQRMTQHLLPPGTVWHPGRATQRAALPCQWSYGVHTPTRPLRKRGELNSKLEMWQIEGRGGCRGQAPKWC